MYSELLDIFPLMMVVDMEVLMEGPANNSNPCKAGSRNSSPSLFNE